MKGFNRDKKPAKNLRDLHPERSEFRDERDWEQLPLEKDGRVHKRTLGRTDDKLPLRTLFYRDYMWSDWWKKRRATYYERHAKVCKVCGATTHVELHFEKYGHYSYERDSAFLPLCRIHHEMLHKRLGVRGDIRYQSRAVVKEMTAQWDAEHEVLHATVSRSARKTSIFEGLIDRLARPIWRSIGKIRG